MATKAKLLNYTTTIEPEKTIAELQRKLALHGASHIAWGYSAERIPNAISFCVDTSSGPRTFVIPVDIDAVLKVLQEQRRKGLVPPRLCSREQAARVGWRIVKDSIETQLALVEIGLANFDQVMLGFLQLRGGSVYDLVRSKQLALPGNGTD
jgi:hypothetical protein